MRFRDTTAVLLVSDIASTMEWYERVLGFAARAVPDEPPYAFAILSKDDVEIFLQALAGFRKSDHYDERAGGAWNVYIHVDGVRELYDALSKRGDVTILERLRHQEYGQTELVIRDPNGYVLVFAQSD